jgi:hypothetical protein
VLLTLTAFIGILRDASHGGRWVDEPDGMGVRHPWEANMGSLFYLIHRLIPDDASFVRVFRSLLTGYATDLLGRQLL